MSTLHLSAGSVDPPRTEGLLRLYSMLYCPFALRSRLVLKAKGIPHEIVNINLAEKPEWYFKINPKGLVPALVDGSKIVVESLDICYYLDDKYPNNRLSPTNEAAKQSDRDLISKAGPFVWKMAQDLTREDVKRTREVWVQEFVNSLQVLEDELVRRKSPFFWGEKPGMLDYMIWPWIERTDIVEIKHPGRLPFKDDQIPLMRRWKKLMRKDPACAELHIAADKYLRIARAKRRGEAPPYDSA